MGRLSGQILRGVLGKQLREREEEEGQSMQSSLSLPSIPPALSSKRGPPLLTGRLNTVSAHGLPWSNPGTLSLLPSQWKAHQAWLSDIIKDLFSLKRPHLPVNCIANTAFGRLPSFLKLGPFGIPPLGLTSRCRVCGGKHKSEKNRETRGQSRNPPQPGDGDV